MTVIFSAVPLKYDPRIFQCTIGPLPLARDLTFAFQRSAERRLLAEVAIGHFFGKGFDRIVRLSGDGRPCSDILVCSYGFSLTDLAKDGK